ncbi:NAD+ synthase [Curvibacter lanceolatus]|uniref:NAD+ synthase n=1 Tax=Curvibacter lanceolatus TaxID=86182 RepID=UPI00037ABCBD|nr:NAD+ synthase [Curvibacter lanceolatus]
MLKITLAQLNPTVGDIDGNVTRMTQAAQRAWTDGSDMIVFPELSLTGYYPGDLLDDPAFLERVARGLEAIKQASRQIRQLVYVIGSPMPRNGAGKRLSNALLAIQAGEVVLSYSKQLLPTYNILDERRHFEPGPDVAPVLRVGQARVGFMVCEDGWNDHGQDYEVNPFQRMSDAAPDLVVSINASPSDIGKRELRQQVFAKACKRHGLPLLYVNQVGGQDQIVFDGASFAVEPQAGVVFEARRFEEDITTLRFEQGRFLTLQGELPPRVSREGLSTMAFYRAQIVLGLRDYARRCGFKQAVVGSSGGIDSALTLALAVDALGASNVAAVTMPSQYSSAGSVDDSVTLCRNLGIELFTHPIVDTVRAHSRQFEATYGQELAGLALENLQARIRGTVLMAHSNSFGHLLLTTGNKSEISVGYCTLYGDTNGGLGLIGDLYKTEVFALARHMNEVNGHGLIPQAIIDKEPSAELAPGQKDSDSLPPYPVLDPILKYVVEGERLAPHEYEQARTLVEGLRHTRDGAMLIERIRRMVARSEYKRRQAPPIIRVRAKAFGSGRQMPIAAQHL